ncbi:alpha/beta hydrolase [Caballeronia sp. LjRoot34]|uniref:serine aminopeptidase domain-containing protein n=1 Tax=Caballeronia sp. LjRoot34 TaxID=3342325 RepID=UPI003ECD9923
MRRQLNNDALSGRNFEMTPIIFDHCFGWLHEGGPAATRGVVLCQPFGREAMWVHKGWRVFAEALADSGTPALRFDYAGTGDSAGESEDGEQIERWLRSIRSAIAYLKESTGVTQVVLCGLRLGATLAALVAADEEVDQLVLLAPVLSGRQYLRELRLLQQNWLETGGIHVAPPPADADYAEAVGHRLIASSVAMLSKFDLLRDARLAERAPRRLLVLDSYDPSRSKKLVEACHAAGADAQFEPFDECAAFMQESGVTETPRQAIARIVEWLGVTEQAESTVAASIAKPSESPVLVADGVRETPVIFDNGRLFGILCEPEERAQSRRSVVFVNPGATHRIGDARISVTLARRLARQGFASLRFDIGTLGDSAAVVDKRPLSLLFSRSGCDDVVSAAAFLAERGFDDVSCFAVCSGAYVCLHAAPVSPHIRSLVLVNAPKFGFPEDPMSFAANDNRPKTATSTFMRSFKTASKWKRVLRGQRRLTPIVKELTRRLGARLKASAAYFAECTIGVDSSGSRVRAMVRQLGERDVKVRFVYGAGDPGMDEFAVFFGAGGRRMRKWRNVETVHHDTLDHACFSYSAREEMMASFVQFVQGEPPQAARGGIGWARLGALLPRFTARATAHAIAHTNRPDEMPTDMHAKALESR